MRVIHDQKNARHGTWGSSIWGGCDAHIPAHGERGVEYRSPTCFDAYFLPRSTGGRFGVRPFSHSSLLSRLPPGFEHRRIVVQPLRQSATLCRCRLARGPQFGFPHNLVRQDRYVPESHSFKSFHGVTFHIQEHVMEGVGSAQNLIGEIQYDDC